MADENGDGELDREEFAAFLYPEDVPRMREIVITEAMEDIDKNRDGFVTVKEYISEFTHHVLCCGAKVKFWGVLWTCG